MKAGRIALIAVAAALIFAFFAFDLGQYFRLDYIRAQQAAIDLAYRDSPLLVALAFFALYVLATAVSLPAAGILTLAAGAIFGLAYGVLIASFASSIGATLAFLASRFLFRDFVQRRFGDRMNAIDAGVRKEGGFYLFTLRLVPANLAMSTIDLSLMPMAGREFRLRKALEEVLGRYDFVVLDEELRAKGAKQDGRRQYGHPGCSPHGAKPGSLRLWFPRADPEHTACFHPGMRIADSSFRLFGLREGLRQTVGGKP